MAHGGPDRVAPGSGPDDKLLFTVEPIGQGRHRLAWREAATGKLINYSGPPDGQNFLTAFAVTASR